MKRAVFDTNIIIDWLNNHQKATALLLGCEEPLISVIVWMEVMVGAKTQALQRHTRSRLEGFQQIGLDSPIIERAVAIRRDKGLKLWDAIIWATAIEENTVLITRNSKDFPAGDPGVLIPYKLN